MVKEYNIGKGGVGSSILLGGTIFINGCRTIAISQFHIEYTNEYTGGIKMVRVFSFYPISTKSHFALWGNITTSFSFLSS